MKWAIVVTAVWEIVLGFAVIVVARSVPVGFQRTVVSLVILVGLQLSQHLRGLESDQETQALRATATDGRIVQLRTAVAKLQQEVARLAGRWPDPLDYTSTDEFDAERGRIKESIEARERIEFVRLIVRSLVSLYLVAAMLVPAFS